ncbi:MAG: PsbP-related protein [Methanobacteriaceae archaeon]|nr:PsbP-related protein [Methanobacteriaceae archaeon]
MKKPSISKKSKPALTDKCKYLLDKLIGKGKPPILLIIILLLILASIAYILTANSDMSSNPTSVKNQKNKNNSSIGHYEDKIISFNYPPAWKVSQEAVKQPMVVTIEKNLTNSFSVFREELGTKNFVDRLKEWRETIESQGDIYYERTITVDGVTAYDVQSTYAVGSNKYSSRGIAIEKNKTAYFIIFVFDGPLIDYEEEMDLVLKSFHVK